MSRSFQSSAGKEIQKISANFFYTVSTSGRGASDSGSEDRSGGSNSKFNLIPCYFKNVFDPFNKKHTHLMMHCQKKPYFSIWFYVCRVSDKSK